MNLKFILKLGIHQNAATKRHLEAILEKNCAFSPFSSKQAMLRVARPLMTQDLSGELNQQIDRIS
jgi:hypothetical protein